MFLDIVDKPIHPKTVYLCINQYTIPLLGWDAMLQTLLWKFMPITFTKQDIEESEFNPDPDTVVFGAIRS